LLGDALFSGPEVISTPFRETRMTLVEGEM
jgi:hypothetical protein